MDRSRSSRGTNVDLLIPSSVNQKQSGWIAVPPRPRVVSISRPEKEHFRITVYVIQDCIGAPQSAWPKLLAPSASLPSCRADALIRIASERLSNSSDSREDRGRLVSP
jgi:hypothetical protein